MSKTISKIIDHCNRAYSLLTINEGKKRFHMLMAGDKKIKKGIFSAGQKKLSDLIRAGYTLVPFEEVFDHMDECEMYDIKGNLVKAGRMDLSEYI